MKDSVLQQLRSLCNIEYVLAIAGMFTLWPVLRAPFQFTVMAAGSASGFHPHFFYDVCLVAFGALMALLLPAFGCVLISMRVKAVCSIGAGLLCAMGSGLLLGGSEVGGVINAAASFGAILLALGIALLFALWSLRVIQMGFGSFCCCVTLSFAFSFLFGAFDYFGSVLRALCFLLPLGSAGLLCCAFLRLDRCFAHLDSQGAFADSCDAGDEGDILPRAQTGDYMVLVFLAVGLIASAVVRSLWMHDLSGYNMKPGLVPTYIISIALAVSYLIVAFLAKEKGLGMLLSVTLTMATLFVGILLCAIVGKTAGLGAVASSHTSFEFLLWAYLALAAFGRPRLALRGVGLWLVAEGATSILAQMVIPRLLGINASTSDDLSVVIALSSMTLIAISFVGLAFLLLRESVKQEPPVINVVGDPSFVDAALVVGEGERVVAPADHEAPDVEESGTFDPRLAEELQRVYGLTEREAQVAACAARGNSVKRVADLLFLAPSTVQGYMKIIYRKMGINRKQSLVDIAQAISPHN